MLLALQSQVVPSQAFVSPAAVSACMVGAGVLLLTLNCVRRGAFRGLSVSKESERLLGRVAVSLHLARPVVVYTGAALAVAVLVLPVVGLMLRGIAVLLNFNAMFPADFALSAGSAAVACGALVMASHGAHSAYADDGAFSDVPVMAGSAVKAIAAACLVFAPLLIKWAA